MVPLRRVVTHTTVRACAFLIDCHLRDRDRSMAAPACPGVVDLRGDFVRGGADRSAARSLRSGDWANGNGAQVCAA